MPAGLLAYYPKSIAFVWKNLRRKRWSISWLISYTFFILNDYLNPGQGSSFILWLIFLFCILMLAVTSIHLNINRVKQWSQSILLIQINLTLDLYVHLIWRQNFKQSWAFSFNAGLQTRVTWTQYFDSESENNKIEKFAGSTWGTQTRLTFHYDVSILYRVSILTYREAGVALKPLLVVLSVTHPGLTLMMVISFTLTAWNTLYLSWSILKECI